MKKRLFATMLLFTCILSLTSCSKDDGDWDAMKWEKNNYEEVLTPSFGKAIGVPKSGGTYTFVASAHTLTTHRCCTTAVSSRLQRRCCTLCHSLTSYLRLTEFFSPELMDMLRTANALNKWNMTLDTAQYKRMYQRISAIEFSILRIGEYPIPSIIDIVNSIRLVKGNVFAEWKQSDTAKLFEDHGYKNKKESSGDVTPKSCIFM